MMLTGSCAFDCDDRFECIQERALRSLLVGCAARHDHLAELVVDKLGVKRRALPVLGVDRLHVVHQVYDECLVGARVVVTPHARVAVGRHDRGFRETEVLEILAHDSAISRTPTFWAEMDGCRSQRCSAATCSSTWAST